MTATLRYRNHDWETVHGATVRALLDIALLNGAISATIGGVTYTREGLCWTYHTEVIQVAAA